MTGRAATPQHADETAAAAVSTPCIDVCVLGADGLCRGCARTVDEIVAWAGLSEAARRAVMQTLPARRRTMDGAR